METCDLFHYKSTSKLHLNYTKTTFNYIQTTSLPKKRFLSIENSILTD